jgi:chromosome segregation ATPase
VWKGGEQGMSYSICRIAKVKASGVTGIQIHDRREKESVSHTNKDIDWSKTHENVDLLEQRQRFRTVISGQIAELNLPRAIRKDATVMTQCLVTSDSAFFDKMPRKEQTDYFRKSLDFIEKRYGKENMVSATVHYDEQTPHMDSRISELKDKVSRVRNSLLEARSDLKGVKAPLERLKDLESENKALQAYSEKHPAMQKDMQTFHGLKEKAYQFGDRLVERKTQYQQIIKRHHKSIEETKALEIRVQEHNGSVSDLRQRQGNFNTSSERLEGLEGQLESTKGVFKILQRKEIQADIDKEKVILQELSDNLKTDYSIEADAIPSRVESLLDKKTELVKEKQTQIEYTNKCEQVKGVVIQEYKYTEALSDTQDKDFREISARHDALEKLPDHNDERHFRTSRDDRAWIVDRNAGATSTERRAMPI